MNRAYGTLVIALVLVLRAASAHATTIEFTTADLSGGRWEYEYFLRGDPFPEGQGFAIFFDEALYSALELQAPSPGNGHWDPLLAQPDLALNSDGYYDVLALIADPSLIGPFRVSFLWTGLDTPGSQPFEIYQLDEDLVRVLDSGRTVGPVPEPSTLLLLTAGAGLLRFVPRRRSR
jgi:hypothetical protein